MATPRTCTRPPNLPPATSIHPAALALLNIKLPGGGFLIPTPQADGRYSGSAISTYREDQFNANIDYRASEKDWLAMKFFFSNAPQFAALPGNDANVPGFGAEWAPMTWDFDRWHREPAKDKEASGVLDTPSKRRE